MIYKIFKNYSFFVRIITDIAKYKSDDPNAVIVNWIRNRNTIELLGVWEILYNPVFNPLESRKHQLRSDKRRAATERTSGEIESHRHSADAGSFGIAEVRGERPFKN